MDFNFSHNIAYCREFVDSLKTVILYSHIPAAMLTLVVSSFVWSRARNSRLAGILLTLSIFFCLWVVCNLFIWLGFAHSSLVMTAWSVIEPIAVLLFALTFYFTFVFLFQRDLSPKAKLLFVAILLPLFVLAPTKLNLTMFDLTECVALENPPFLYYVLALKALFTFLTVFYLVKAFIRSSNISKRLITILSIGIVGFLFSFLATGYITDQTGIYKYESYGLLGVVIFVASLSVLIVRFQLFNIKLLSTQILVAGLLFLIGSEYLFVESQTAFALVTITLFLSLFFGYLLIRSVKREVEQREQLEVYTEKLQTLNVELKEKDALKSEFLSLAAHQIRSPLTAVKGYASMILDGTYGKVSAGQTEAINRIFESTNHLVNVVNDLLNIAKIEQGGLVFEMALFDIKRALVGVVDEMKLSAKNKNITIAFGALTDTEYIVRADLEKMRQVFLNLLDNSLKYTKEGGHIDVHLARDTKNNMFEITIKDTGIGMSHETIDKLFEKFARGEGRTSNSGGSGLGLYLAKQIVEAHKGTIVAESQGLGHGSTFIIRIPPGTKIGQSISA